jgi:hypothetical protein
MLAIKDQVRQRAPLALSATNTRKYISDAQAGKTHVLELEQMTLNQQEVARFLVQQIPVMRAAAIGGGLENFGMFLEEIYYTLRARAELAPDHQTEAQAAVA